MKTKKLDLLPLKALKVNDFFWNKYTGLVTKEIIPYQWKALNDEVADAEPSYCIDNFKVAAGLKEGTFHGWVFQDTDLAKWLEAVAYSLSYEPNEALEKLADDAIELVGKAQQENGYINTHFTILHPGKQYCNLKEGHELYTTGHFIEAAIAYYEVTGKDKFLNIMKKNADLICDVFHTEKYKNAVPGHEEIELALMKLATITGDDKYADMAKDFIDRRGTEPNYLFNESKSDDFIDVWHDPNPYINEYGQNHLPVRKQKTAEGHAVRATYLYCAMADIAQKYQDESLFEACENLYNNIVNKRMYITGGIGSSGVMERFTTDYDLPNDTNYSESCASIGLALFCRRMAQITGDSKYIDTMELALMNTVLAGIAMDGKSFFYVNPLEVWPDNCMPATDKNHVKAVRQKWFGCACCPPNIARIVSSVESYAYTENEDTLWTHLYMGSEVKKTVNGDAFTLNMTSKMPWSGEAQATIKTDTPVTCTLAFRIPGWSNAAKAEITTTADVERTQEKGYVYLTGTWKDGDSVTFNFPMPVHMVMADSRVREDIGKVAFTRGPVTYCMEEIDNGKDLHLLHVDMDRLQGKDGWNVELAVNEEMGHPMTILKVPALREEAYGQEEDSLYTEYHPVKDTPVQAVFVPYYAWNNRGEGEMSVWIRL